jgi:hypothetical protein
MAFDRDMRPRPRNGLSQRVVRGRCFNRRVGKLVHGSERTRHSTFDSRTVMTLRRRQGDADSLGAAGGSVNLGTNGNLHLHVGVEEGVEAEALS